MPSLKSIGNNIGSVLRNHVEREHPELYNKIQNLEKQISQLKRELRDTIKECNQWVNGHRW